MARPDLEVHKHEDADICPHCGARLLSRHARRQHLTLAACVRGRGELPENLGVERPPRTLEPSEQERWAFEDPPRRRR